MKISVVTPSLGQPEWLRLCAASVADQAGVEVEHRVQDALSGPEVSAVAREFRDVRFLSEADGGMYDAIARGWARSSGEVLAWLNCDEQYLPGTLARVARYFTDHPEVEVLVGDALIVDPAGAYICSRQVLPPLLYHTWICHLSLLSCALFFRRSALVRYKIEFNPRWRTVGDADLVVQLLRSAARFGYLREYLALSTDTGTNLSQSQQARVEMAALAQTAPAWAQALRRFWVILHRVRRLRAGLYRVAPFATEIYRRDSPGQRTALKVVRPTFYWPGQIDWRS